jgi:transposase-like protein
MMYYSGMSFRRVADMIGVAPEAVRYWWNRLAFMLDYVRGPHGVVVADETGILVGIKAEGRPWILWVGIDANTLQVVNLKFARYQYSLDCRDFLAEIAHKSRPDTPIVIHDRGVWYEVQAEKLGLPHHHVRGGVRSLIECWNRQLKHRLDGFFRVFPHNARIMQVERWLRSYAAVWNLTRGW